MFCDLQDFAPGNSAEVRCLNNTRNHSSVVHYLERVLRQGLIVAQASFGAGRRLTDLFVFHAVDTMRLS
jgi:hypothetical protein